MGLKHLPAIDGLRAIAVLSVVAYHAGAPAGFVGVDVFFVISGYLITRLLMEDGRLVEFYARRARRILPAAFLCVVVTLGLSFVLLPSTGDVARSAAAAGLFVANLFFQSATGDYWSADAASMPLLHLWSLSVEEQFYLAWPLVLLVAFRGHTPMEAGHALRGNGELLSAPVDGLPAGAQGEVALRHGDGGQVEIVEDDVSKSRVIPWNVVGALHPDNGHIVLWLIFGLSFALYAWLSYADPNAAFYQTPARAWELAAGGLVAVWYERLATKTDRVRVGGKFFGRHRLERSAPRDHLERGAVYELSAAPVNGADDTPREEADYPAGLLHGRARLQVPAILRNLAAFVLQHASHIGLALILLSCLVPLPVPVAVVLSVFGTAMVIGCTTEKNWVVQLLSSKPLVWVGLISYSLYLWHWPLLALDRALRVGEAPLETRLALVAAAFVLAALSYRYVEQPFRRMRTPPKRAVALGVACAAALATTAFALADPPKAKTQIFASTKLCHADARLQAPECVPGPNKVVLWSDSSGWAWMGYVERLAAEQGMSAVSMQMDGCPIVLADVPRGTPMENSACRRRAERELKYLQQGADTVFVTAYWARLFRERPDAGPHVLAWARALPNVRRIIVVGAVPEIRDSVEKCQALKVSCDIPRADYERSAQAEKAVMRELDALPNVEVWEVGDWMCDADKCRAVRGIPLYMHDNHHVSVEAANAYVKENRQ